MSRERGVRVWDVAAGYLSRQSLLGEHRELHGLRSILVHGKTGYSRHPETLRWVGCLSGLAQRHEMLAAEMAVRGYQDRTPVEEVVARPRWPSSFVNPPREQLELLRAKYVGRAGGRIPLPRTGQELWAQHKYSVMARDPETYRKMGRRVSGMRRGADFSALSEDVVMLLRESPSRARLVNALEHMWGHVSRMATRAEQAAAGRDPGNLLLVTRTIAFRTGEPYLITSTALSELAVFAGPGSAA